MVRQSLLGAEVLVGPADLTIDEPLLDLARSDGARVVADRRCAVLRMPAVGTFAVQGGRRVVVQPADGAEGIAVEAWLQGTVAALLLAQRTRFALHANLVAVGGSAVALAGARGAGKTTTSLRVAQRGGVVLGDDVLPLEATDGGVTCRTIGRPLHVGPETAAALGLDLTAADRLRATEDKRLLPLPPAPAAPLDHVVVLSEASVDGVEHRRLAGAAAVRAVLSHAYRARLLGRVWRAELFTWASAVAAAVPVHVVQRPEGRWSGDEVAAAIEAIAAEPGRDIQPSA